jgi:hypothetical protein
MVGILAWWMWRTDQRDEQNSMASRSAWSEVRGAMAQAVDLDAGEQQL